MIAKNKICPYSGDVISHVSTWFRIVDKKFNVDKNQARIDFIKCNFPEIFENDCFIKLYRDEQYSFPMLKREFSIQYKLINFLIKYFNLDKRDSSRAAKVCAPKREKTCMDKYGADNPSKSEICKKKRSDTMIERYGADNIRKTQKCQDSINKTIEKKYGVSRAEFQRIRSREAYAKSPVKYLRSKGGMSSIEREVKECLDRMGIKYEQQYQIRHFVHNYNKLFLYDFYLPEFDMLIEVQGDFYHANPAKYDEKDMIDLPGGPKGAKRIWKRDDLKKKIAQDHGYSIDYIWELEIKQCKKSKRGVEYLINRILYT